MRILFAHPETYEWAETDVYMKKALQKLGHEVISFDDLYMKEQYGLMEMNNQLIQKVDEIKPDLFLTVRGEFILPGTLGAMECKKVMFYTDVREHVQDWVIAIAPSYDVFTTMSKGSVPEYKELGVNVHYLPEACWPEDHKQFPIEDKYKCDISFIGTVRKQRVQMIEELVKSGYNVKIFGSAPSDLHWKIRRLVQKPVYREEHSKVCSSSKISITWDWCPGVELSFSNRIWKVMGAGCVYLAKYVKGMEIFFDNNKHMIWFKDLEEMKKHIDYLLKQDKLRETIGKNAQNLVYEKHTYTHRMKELLRLCKL